MSAGQEPLDYAAALIDFDAALCESLAVSQGCAERPPLPHVAYGSHLFARLCAHGTAMMRAAPRSRWVTSDHEDWNFCVVAPHARAILEGFMFFAYLTEDPSSEDEWKARVNMMHLNDCTRRIALMDKIDAVDDLKGLSQQQDELRQRLLANPYFNNLPPKVQRECLKGEKPWLKTREQMLEAVGIDKADYDAIWLLYSQHSHILPMSFYRIEPNGRGTGVENEVDREYIARALVLGAALLRLASDRMVILFPDLAPLRKGLKSKFCPGPKINAPIHNETPSVLQERWLDLEESTLTRVVSSYIRVANRSNQ